LEGTGRDLVLRYYPSVETLRANKTPVRIVVLRA
jgi:hypothetical protein